MHRRNAVRFVAVPIALSMLVAACGDDDEDPATTEAPTSQAPSTEPSGETTAAPADGGFTDALAGVCPDTVVIQTDWFPEAEHGALYEMIGEGYEIDTNSKVVRGPLVASGEDTGVDIEVRTGGPAIGYAAVHAQMYADDSITLGYTSIDASASFFEDQPTVAVVAPLEKNPQIIMWDPETYPDVETISDLSEAGVTINVFPGVTFMDVFVNEGTVDADLVDGSYDGSPARFIAEEGKIAQQGFASSEPYTYENDFEDWGRPVAYQLIHDAGFESYSQPLGVRSDRLEELRPCLEVFVPIVQQATIDYILDPVRANAIIVDTVATFDDFWVYGDGVAAFGAQAMKDLELVSNGPDSTIGNFDEARVQTVIDQMIAVELAPAGLTAAELVSNEFIDPTIGL